MQKCILTFTKVLEWCNIILKVSHSKQKFLDDIICLKFFKVYFKYQKVNKNNFS